MKKFLHFIISGLIIFWTQLTYASSLAATQTNLNNLIYRFNPNLNIGVIVQSADSGNVLYQKNANQLFMPASVMKVFPAVAAFSFLGPDYKFKTKVLAPTTNINQGVLTGNIYIYFDGDPTLTRQDLNNLIATLSQLGITQINGNIYVDDTIFDQDVFGPGWMWDERNFCYAAPTSAITLDKNCFPLQIAAATQAGQIVPATTTHDFSFMPITSQVVSRYSNYDDCPLDLRANGDNSYYLTGCIKPSTPAMNLMIAVRNVRLYAQNVLQTLLAANNISLAGQIKFGSLPSNVQLNVIAEHDSEPLSELINTMLKKSDNLIADAVYKKLGYAYFHKTATWRNSAKAIASILEANTNVNFKKMRIVDGSGLSRYNLVSPAQLSATLIYAYHDNAVRSSFMEALSKAGIDGTMQYRMPNLRGRIFAKTGNMANISSLTGYIITASHQTLTFAILINGFLDKPHVYHKLQDQICELLARSI